MFRDQNLHELLSPSGRCACHGHYQQDLDNHDYHHYDDHGDLPVGGCPGWVVVRVIQPVC